MLLETMQAATITVFVENVFNFLWKEGRVKERIRMLFKADPQKKAFQEAFMNVYQQFCEAYPKLASSLFDPYFLETRAVPILACSLTPHDPPDPIELAEACLKQFRNLSTSERDAYIEQYTLAAADFLRWLHDELRHRNEFRLIFDSHALDTTANATAETAEGVKGIETTQQELLKATKAGFSQLNTTIKQLSTPTIPDTVPALHPNAPPLQSAPPRSGICPFEYGSTVPPERFYGRHSQRADIKNRIGGISAQCISIVGMRRSGKSSLLRYIKERLHEFCRLEQQAFVVTLDLQKKRFHTPNGLVEGLRRGIERKMGYTPWQKHENDDEWAVEDGLIALCETDKRLIVLIDEFELLSTRLQAFQGWGEDWRSKAAAGYFALVIASLRPIDEIYQANGLTSPFGNLFMQTELGAFTYKERQKLVRDGFARNGEDVSEENLGFIYDLAGGLPYYTQMAAALLWQYRDHTQTKMAFAHQATPRFTELWNDLKENECQALYHIADRQTQAIHNVNLHANLQRYGLLRVDGQLFSCAFTEFIREQS